MTSRMMRMAQSKPAAELGATFSSPSNQRSISDDVDDHNVRRDSSPRPMPLAKNGRDESVEPVEESSVGNAGDPADPTQHIELYKLEMLDFVYERSLKRAMMDFPSSENPSDALRP
jgi:hypothetical protein